MSAYTRKSLADYLDSYDEEIASLQESKREMLQDYRAQLAEKGFGKSAIKAEIDGLKVAMRRRRAITKKGAEEVDQADAIADEIFLEITASARRDTRARENIEEFPLKADTRLGQDVQSPRQCTSAPENLDVTAGETATQFTDEPEAAAEVAGDYLREPVAAEQGQIIREGDAPRETGRDISGDASSPDTDFQPPAFLTRVKTAADYRPHCLNPDTCGSSTLDHCYSCRKAIGEVEAA